MEKEEKKTVNNKINILDNSKKKTDKIILIIIISLILLGVIAGLAYIKYFYSPEKQLNLGAEIESIALDETGNNIYVKLSGGSNEKQIKQVKFSFRCDEDEYVYETNEGIREINVSFKRGFLDWLKGKGFEGVYNYEIGLNSIDGLNSFECIDSVDIVFIYEDKGEIVESPVVDTERPTTSSGGGGSGGGSGGGGGCTDTCESLGYDCGIHMICSAEVDCGVCPDYVSYYKFESETDSITPDEQEVNPGTLVGASIVNDIDKGNVLSFDGTGYVQVSDDNSLDIVNEITLSVWVKLNSANSYSKIIIKPYETDSNPWELYTIDLGSSGITPRFILSDGVLDGESLSASSSSLELNQWYHILGTYDGNVMSLYINGNPIDSATGVLNIGANDMDLSIGGRLGSYGVDGFIDDVRIYNKALNEAEVLSLYDLEKPAEEPCSLTSAFWNPLTADEGDSVELNVLGSNCFNQLINYEVWEDIAFWFDNQIMETSSTGKTIWIAGQGDSNFNSEDDYYFKAIVDSTGQEIISDRNNDLIVNAVESCSDGIKNQDETDVDCGGVCSGCLNGDSCLINSDCSSDNCVDGICELQGECGNGILEGEECDDNNLINGDGCSDNCLIESGWDCEGEPSVCSEIITETYYLDAVNGDDNNPGTSELPWKTIDRAKPYSGLSPEVVSGDTVILGDGSYGEWQLSGVDAFTSTGEWITYKAEGNVIFEELVWANLNKAYIKLEGLNFICAGYGANSESATDNSYTVVFNNVDYVDMNNILIQGCGDSDWYGSGMKVTMNSGQNSNHITLRNSEIYDVLVGLGFSSANHLIIDNVTIHHTSDDLISGANLDNSIIRNSRFYDAEPRYEFGLWDGDNTLVGNFQEGELVVQDFTGASGTIIKTLDRTGYWILYLNVTNYDYEDDSGYYAFSYRKLTPVVFNGVGLDDFNHNGEVWRLDRLYMVNITYTMGPVDRFDFLYSQDNGQTWTAFQTDIEITGSLQELYPSNSQWKLKGSFGSTTGHTLGDHWIFETGEFYPIRGQSSNAVMIPSYEGQANHADAIQIYIQPNYYDWSENVTISNNIISKKVGQGVFLKQMKDVLIENNILFGGFTSHPLSVQTSSLSASIRDNTVCLDREVSDISLAGNWVYWAPNTRYRSTTIVRPDSSSNNLYRLIQEHTSATNDKPESGVNWLNYWEQINPDEMVFNVENNLICGRLGIDYMFGKTLNLQNNHLGIFYHNTNYDNDFLEIPPTADSSNYEKGDFLTEQERINLFADYNKYDLSPISTSIICDGTHSGTTQGVAWAGALGCVEAPEQNTFYVATSVNGCSDSNDGLTSETPWCLTGAQSYANANPDVEITFLLKGGDYGEFDLVNAPIRTAWVNWNDNGANVLFDSINIFNAVQQDSYQRFDGINVQIPTPSPLLDPDDPPWSMTSAPVSIQRANYVEISNANLTGWNKYLTGYGVNMVDSDNVTIYNCDISVAREGVDIDRSSDVNIINNNIHSLSEMGGVRLPGGDGGVLIEGNHIHDMHFDFNDAYFPPDRMYDGGDTLVGTFIDEETVRQINSTTGETLTNSVGTPITGILKSIKDENGHKAFYILATGPDFIYEKIVGDMSGANFTPTDRMVGMHFGQGISVRVSNLIIRNNTIHDGFSNAIYFYPKNGVDLTYEKIVIENNLVYDTPGGIFLNNINGSLSIKNNTVIRYTLNTVLTNKVEIARYFSVVGINVKLYDGYDGADVEIKNNLIMGDIGLPDFANPFEEDYNLVWSSGYVSPTSSTLKGANSFVASWYTASPSALRGWPNFFGDIGFNASNIYNPTPEYDYDRDGIQPFFVNPNYRTNPQDPEFQDGMGGDWDYHPLMSSPICNGGYIHGVQVLNGAIQGVAWAGALECVGELGSLNIFTQINNYLKDLFGISGMSISGNAISEVGLISASSTDGINTVELIGIDEEFRNLAEYIVKELLGLDVSVIGFSIKYVDDASVDGSDDEVVGENVSEVEIIMPVNESDG